MLARYRVGRGSLREALRILEVYGLIAIRPGPGGGPVVQEVNSREFGRTTTFYYRLARATYRDVLEAREIFEPMMAKVAAQRANDAEIKELVESAALARLAVERDDETWGAAAGDFHGLLSGMSGNHILDIVGRSFKDIARMRTLREALRSKTNRLEACEQHEAVADAIRRRKPDLAERRMADHMREFVDIVSNDFPTLLDEVVDWQ
jgi:DNA-binding FadR family transcriptional regulator